MHIHLENQMLREAMLDIVFASLCAACAGGLRLLISVGSIAAAAGFCSSRFTRTYACQVLYSTTCGDLGPVTVHLMTCARMAGIS